MRYARAVVLLFTFAFVGACKMTPPISSGCAPENTCVNGTVTHMELEGGFWAIRGDDGVTYDPAGGLASEFQQQGLRVYMVARKEPAMASIHMAGPIVSIISLRRITE